MKTHVLKCWSEYFDAVITGDKTAELRVNDRNYQVGDRLLQREYDPHTDTYSGRWHMSMIRHIVVDLDGRWLQPGIVMLSIQRLYTSFGDTWQEVARG